MLPRLRSFRNRSPRRRPTRGSTRSTAAVLAPSAARRHRESVLALSDESFRAKHEWRRVEVERGTGFEPATTSLEGWCSATELPPQIFFDSNHFRTVRLEKNVGGQGGIRTPEGVSQQIYSLPPLAAWVPARL